MRKSRFSDEQIVGILKEHAAGEPIGSVVPAPWHQPADALSLESQVRRLGRTRASNASKRWKRRTRGSSAWSPSKPSITKRSRTCSEKTGEARAAAGGSGPRPGALGFSQRQACRLVGSARSTIRYRSRRQRGRGAACPAAGAGRAASPLRLPAPARPAAAGGDRRQPQAGRTTLPRGRLGGAPPHAQIPDAASGGVAPLHPERANEQWALDFLQDALASGRTSALLSVIDVFTREALALEVDTSLPGSRVVRVLDRLLG